MNAPSTPIQKVQIRALKLLAILYLNVLFPAASVVSEIPPPLFRQKDPFHSVDHNLRDYFYDISLEELIVILLRVCKEF